MVDYRYGLDNGNDYIAFHRRNVGELSDTYGFGSLLGGFGGLRSMTFRRNPRGDGHIAIYEVDHEAGAVNILHVFHTKQDVQGRLRQER